MKQKLTYFYSLLLTALFLLPWSGAKAQTLFSENFEGGSMPTGWTKDGSGTWSIGTGDYSSSTGAGQGTYNAKINHGTTGNKTKLISPVIDLSTAGSANLSYMHIQRSWSGDIDQLRVYYRTSSSGTWTLLTGQEFTGAVASWTTESNIELPNLSDTYQIAFEMTDKYGYGIGIDDVKIYKPAACDAPTAPTASDVTYAGATLSWTVGSDEEEWNLQYKEAADADWTLVEGLTTNSYSLVASNPGTTYQAQVAAVCKNGNGYSDWTDFEAIEIPCDGQFSVPTEGWTHNFEGDETGYGKIPACWTAQTYNATYKYPYVNGSSAHSGSKCLYFSGGSSTSPQSIILPEFNVDLQDYTLSFYYNNGTTDTDYPTLRVGYYETDGDISSEFKPYKELSLVNSYTLAEIDLKDFSETHKHIVIYYGDGTLGHAAYVDDIKLSLTPNCIKPTEVAGANATATTAEISWTAGGSETAWKLQYTTVNPLSATESDWTDANSGNDITDNPYTLTGLTPNKTAYYARVKAVCDGSETSDWSNASEAFYTECAAKAIPFIEGFESTDANAIPTCWDNSNGADSYVYANTMYTNYAYKGSHCLRMYGGGSSSVQTVLLPEMEEDIKKLSLSLYYRNGSTGASYGKLQVGYVKSGAFTPLATVDQASSYTLYELDLKDADDDAEYIALRHATGSSDYGSLYVDSITVSLTPTCLKPTAMDCPVSTDTKAKLTWTAGKNETAWKVEYSENSDFSESTTVAADANPFWLEGLTAGHTYYARVKADCGGGDESDWCITTVSFTTECEAITVDATNLFEQNFDGISSGIPSCWKNNKGTTTTASAKWNSYATGYEGRCVRFNSYNNATGLTNTLETPLLSLGVNANLNFWCKNPAGGAYTVTMYVVETDATVTLFDDLSSISAWTEKTVDLSSYNGKTIKLFFNGTSNYANGDAYLYLDEVTVSKASTCFKPATLNAATNITPEGATFTWTTSSANNEGYYQYICVASGETPDWAASTKVAKAETNQAVITGKATGTYDFYVRSWCADEDQSSSVSKSFTTASVNNPANLAVANITNEAASASWDAAAGVSGYEILCVREDGTKDWSNAVQVAASPIALDTLKASREYTIYVRSYYASQTAPTTLYGATELSKTFATKCDPTVVDATNGYTQNFNDLTAAGQIPECWDNSEVSGGTISADNKWSYFATGREGACVRFNSYADNTYGKTNVLASPIFDLKEDADLEFYVKNPTGGAYTVQISVDGGARQNVFTGLTSLTDWTKKEVVLTSYKNHKIQFFFSGTGNGWNNQAYLYLDDFVITPQACRKPASDPVVNSKTGTTASISWGEGGASNYQFAVALKDETPVWETANIVETTSKIVEGLTPLTNYDFYVRTYCDEENQSDARKVSFQTECADYVTLPFEENFNGVAVDAIPECWNNDEGTSTDYYKWKAVTYYGHNTSTCVRFNSSTNADGATNILATPTIKLNEGNLLTFWAKNPTGGDFKVQIEGEGIAREDLLTGLTNIADWTLKYAAIPAKFNNKKVQLFFYATSNEGDTNAYIEIDDVRVARGEVFSDAENNQARFATLAAAPEAIDVIFSRTLLGNGDYNTFCLPFSLDADQLAASPIANFKLKAYDYATIENEELLIAITNASSIEAGVPYFVANTANEPNQTVQFYKDVVITADEPGKVDKGEVSFQGVFDPVDLAAQATDAAHNQLFLAAGNKIYWPAQNRTVKGFRAYFNVTVGSGVLKIKKGMPARIVERAEVVTGINNTNVENVTLKFIENDQVVIIRNSVKYNIQGQVISK